MATSHEICPKSRCVRRKSNIPAAPARIPTSSNDCSRPAAPLAHYCRGLPEDLRRSEEAKLLSSIADKKVYNIVQLIYRSKQYEGHSKDYEFSRLTMEEHWKAGYYDAARTLRHPEVLQRPANLMGFSPSISFKTAASRRAGNHAAKETSSCEKLTCASAPLRCH